MAVLTGKGGSVKHGTNTIAELDEWTLNITTDTEESTAFGDQWHEFEPTLRGWTGSASGRLDITDTNGQVAIQTVQLGSVAAVPVRFYVDGTHYYSGNAIVNSTITDTEAGLITLSYDFQGTGALNYT